MGYVLSTRRRFSHAFNIIDANYSHNGSILLTLD